MTFVSVARTAFKGRQRLEVAPDDLMPRVSGAQLAAAARQVRPKIPVLVATGYAELPPGSGIGMPRISKPYQRDQLAAEIMKVLKQSAGRDVSH